MSTFMAKIKFSILMNMVCNEVLDIGFSGGYFPLKILTSFIIILNNFTNVIHLY